MARADRSTGFDPGGPTVHNGDQQRVVVRMLVLGAAVTAETVTLEPGETVAVPSSPSEAVEVHAAGGMATAPAGTNPTFVVRDGAVLVAPE